MPDKGMYTKHRHPGNKGTLSSEGYIFALPQQSSTLRCRERDCIQCRYLKRPCVRTLPSNVLRTPTIFRGVCRNCFSIFYVVFVVTGTISLGYTTYPDRDSAVTKWINGTLRAYLERQVASQAIPGWYRDSMNVSYIPPPRLRDENGGTMHRGKRQIFYIINLIFGISGTALGKYYTAQIAALQSLRSEIVHHIKQVVSAVSAEHYDLVAIAKSDHSLYQYTHKAFHRSAEQAQEIECRLVEEGAVLLALSKRQRIVTRANVDLSSGVVTLFNGKLIPALLPHRQVVRLLETDRNFQQTIYWDSLTISTN